jgi:ribosomal protein S27AE
MSVFIGVPSCPSCGDGEFAVDIEIGLGLQDGYMEEDVFCPICGASIILEIQVTARLREEYK